MTISIPEIYATEFSEFEKEIEGGGGNLFPIDSIMFEYISFVTFKQSF